MLQQLVELRADSNISLYLLLAWFPFSRQNTVTQLSLDKYKVDGFIEMQLTQQQQLVVEWQPRPPGRHNSPLRSGTWRQPLTKFKVLERQVLISNGQQVGAVIISFT